MVFAGKCIKVQVITYTVQELKQPCTPVIFDQLTNVKYGAFTMSDEEKLMAFEKKKKKTDSSILEHVECRTRTNRGVYRKYPKSNIKSFKNGKRLK